MIVGKLEVVRGNQLSGSMPIRSFTSGSNSLLAAEVSLGRLN